MTAAISIDPAILTKGVLKKVTLPNLKRLRDGLKMQIKDGLLADKRKMKAVTGSSAGVGINAYYLLQREGFTGTMESILSQVERIIETAEKNK